MNDDQFQDLKQFIEATVSQSEARLRADLANKDDLADLRVELKGDIADLKTEIKADIARLEAKLDANVAGAGDAVATTNTSADDQLADLERRVTRLEHRAA